MLVVVLRSGFCMLSPVGRKRGGYLWHLDGPGETEGHYKVDSFHLFTDGYENISSLETREIAYDKTSLFWIKLVQ